MGDITLEGALAVGMLMSMAVFGLYTCLFLLTILYIQRTPRYPIWVTISLSVLWILTLFQIILQVMGFYEGFVQSIGRMSVGQHLMQWVTGWKFLAGIVSIHTSGILGNAFICWRLYVFWKGNMKILILPLTLLVGQIVCCAVTVAYEVKAQKAFWYIPRKNQWLTSVFIISLLVNITVMGLMCLRIHRVSRSVSDLSPAANTLYKHIFQIFIEGGALYGAVLVVALILQGVKLYSCSLMVNFLTPQIIGVVPTLIVLRLLLQTTFQSRRSTGDDTAPSTSQQKTITQPVFAHMTAGDTTRLSEFRRSMQFQGYPITSMSDKYWPDDFSGGAVQ